MSLKRLSEMFSVKERKFPVHDMCMFQEYLMNEMLSKR